MQGNWFEFNFTGLKDIYGEARRGDLLTFAFSLEAGLGRVSFLVRTPQDKEGQPILNDSYTIVALNRTRRWDRYLLLGNHMRAGNFKVRIRSFFAKAIADEVCGVGGDTTGFSLNAALADINTRIPHKLGGPESLSSLRAVRAVMGNDWSKEVDDGDKTHVLSFPRLTLPRRPRENTLLKLVGCDKPESEITELLEVLRAQNTTVAWSAFPPKSDPWAARPRRGDRAPAPAAPQGQDESTHDFERGYFRAVAVLLRDAGVVTPAVRHAFELGGHPEHASPDDAALFAQHGLNGRTHD